MATRRRTRAKGTGRPRTTTGHRLRTIDHRSGATGHRPATDHRPRHTGHRLRAVAGRRARAAARLAGRMAAALRRAAGHTATAGATAYGPPAGGGRVRPATGQRYRPARRVRLGGGPGPGAPVLMVAGLMVLIVAMLGVERVTGVSLLPDRLTAGLRPPPRDFPVLAASRPTGVRIPAIDVDAPVHSVGLAADGTIGVPAQERAAEAGWYEQGPTPGQYGPAVLVGHVDTSSGPAVFHQLKDLDAGDRVEVPREDGSVAVFEVESVQRHDKERFPADQVFGDFTRPHLRLITCGGRWVGGDTGYADNVVVFASLVDAEG
ncbi:class F sortase [Micromonospora rosaria]|uniref:class F sortase n=1 Tax=Micromonospora rosaria TaxID=47874 RepID=UPI0037C64A27